VIGLIVTLVIVGLILWAVESLLPLDATIRRIIHVVIIICVLLYVLRFFGVF
jgi:hypothetical protein